MARYVETGHLVFAREGSLLAVPFDLDQLTVSGAPVVVTDEVAMNYSDGFAAYDVSPTGTLVVLPASVAGSRFQVVEVNRQGTERMLLPTPDTYANPRFAPDQRHFSLDIRPARGATDVWVVDVAQGSRTRVTTEPASDFGADWTSDGDLVYMSERPLFELYRRAADGSRPPRVLLGGGHDRILGGVSDDGRLAVFTLSVSRGSDLWSTTLESQPAAQQYLANGFNLGHPALSPDGRWLAYDSDETGRVETYIQSFPDPTVAKRQVSTGGGSEPLWTRGGRELVFRRGDSVLAVAADPATGQTGTAALVFAGSYFSAPEWSRPRSYDVTPDGQRFLMLRWPTGEVRRRVRVTTGWWPELKARVDPGTRP
jgi:serine/threonine-protein kinase